jgi:NhaP-type Na+/H+ or K+/H+ antiporter
VQRGEAGRGGGAGRYASLTVSNLDRRSSYTPRRVREQRAYRYAMVGSVSGAVGVVGLVLAILTSFPGTVAVIAFIVAAICVFGFLRTTGQR